MVKRGRGRPRNAVSGRTAEFFKVFLPHHSSHQLLIPPDFIKDFNRTIKEKVILKDTGGKTWHVDVEETRNGVFLKNGWQNFVSYHCLKLGDFLVFIYDRNYAFLVKVFGANGCKKEAFAAKNIATHVKIEEKTEEEIEAKQTSCKRAHPDKEGSSLRGDGMIGHSRENCKDLKNADYVLPKSPCFVSPPSQSKQYKLKIPSEVINRHNLHLEPEVALHNANGKEWPVRVYALRDGRTYIGKGW